MADAAFISDRGNVFDVVFREFGFTCMQIVPQAFGSPFCQPTKLLIVPSGFADPKYYKILPALERNREKIARFIENGGIVLAFGAMWDGYEYDWLPMKLKYKMQFKTRNVRLIDQGSPAALLVEPGERDCDGYFTEHDGDTVMALDDGRPVLVDKKYGKGRIVASALHEYPSKRFVEWACSGEREPLTI